MAEAGDLLIGIGNPLRGDDGVGPELAAWAAGQRPQLRVRSVHQLTPELSSELAMAGRVLFIDAWCVPQETPLPQPRNTELSAASLDGDAEGRSGPVLVRLGPLAAAADDSPEAGAFSHRLDPLQLLAITELLHGHAPPAWQLLVPAFRCCHAEGLSPGLEALLPRARRLLSSWFELDDANDAAAAARRSAGAASSHA